MSDEVGVFGGMFGFLNLLYGIIYLCLFWNRQSGSIYIWEYFMLYVWVVFVPLGIIVLIILMIMVAY